jgi:uncharacterized protein (DUF885 family)
MHATHLSETLVDVIASLRPVTATFAGIPGHDHLWDDLSPEGIAHASSILAAYHRRISQLPAPSDPWEKLTIDVMQDWLEQDAAWFNAKDYLLDLNSLASSFQNLRMVFDVMDMTSASGWENIVTRLENFPIAASGYQALLAEGLRQEHTVAARQVKAVIKQAKAYSAEGAFFDTMLGNFEQSKIEAPLLRSRLEKALPKAKQALKDLGDFLEDKYLPKAKPKDAVGRERYIREARRFLGLELNPEETYAWGWREIESLWSEMKLVGEQIAPGKSPQEVMGILQTDPARCAATPEEFLALMRSIQEKAIQKLDGLHFDVPEALKKLEIKTAPPGGSLGAYYMPPSEDLSRPGTIWYSFGPDRPLPLYTEVSTVYHEGFPGHHLQCGLQVALRDKLSRFQRLIAFCSGYAEGWALYTERLADELNFYEKPEYRFGMLACQLHRACRVVLDIGAHLEFPIPKDALFHPGESWTFDLGVEMLSSFAGLTKEFAESEMTRYLGWPAQAIAYKIGEREIMGLRKEFMQKNPQATLKDFHAKVLGCGSLGLDLLRKIVLA